jgi:MFS transporter, PAT family, beta-lactamase induction signal transducer AmpG
MSENIAVPAQPPNKYAHPIVFMFLVLPFGVVAGYVTVALVGAGLLPNVIKFIWTPLIDTTLSLKKWYILSGIVTAMGIFAMGIFPTASSSLPILTVMVILANVASSFLGSTVSALAAHDTPEELKGRASGYLNAGNLGGSGIGGGVGLWLAEHFHQPWISSLVLAMACALCCFGLFFVKEPLATVRAEKIGATIKNLFKDVWQTLKVPMGFLAVVLCFLPLSTGAASNLWSAVAGAWHASAGTVEFVTGIVSGLITAAGCLVGGWICDRMHKKNAYIIFGAIQVLCALGMAYSPHTEWMYIIWTSLYAITLGLSYAAFSAFVFEAIGKGAAATKYTVLSSLSNAPIYYMTLVDGWAFSYFKQKAIGMLDTEAVCGVIGIVLFLGLAAVVNRRKAVLVAAKI